MGACRCAWVRVCWGVGKWLCALVGWGGFAGCVAMVGWALRVKGERFNQNFVKISIT